MELSWGKPTAFEKSTSSNGVAGTDWSSLPIPKEDSLTLTATEGDEVTATEEGGDIVDVRHKKTTYVLEWDEFVRKGDTPSFEDNDGVVEGEFALRITPEDANNEGILIDRSTIVRTDSYTTADGILRHYKANVLKPASGKSVKPYLANSLVVTPTAIYFDGDGDTSTGQTIAVTTDGTISASSSDTSWCTVTTSNKNVIVKASSNGTGAIRTATVAITASDGTTAKVVVTQIPTK